MHDRPHQNLALKVSNLSKTYSNGRKTEISNLSILQGDKIALLGINGAGKSSFIRLLLGEDPFDEGEIRFDPLTPVEDEFKQRLGYQADSMQALAGFTVIEYLRFVSASKRMDEALAEKAISQLVSDWQLQAILNSPLEQLSKGNLQKVMIVQALVNQPNYLVFDEPTQNLDPIEQDRFNQNIGAVTHAALCLFSTHDVNQALSIANRVFLIHESNIVFDFDLTEKNAGLLIVAPKDFAAVVEQLNALDDKVIKRRHVARPAIQLTLTSEKAWLNLIEALNASQFDFECIKDSKASAMTLFRLLASGEINNSDSKKIQSGAL